MNALRRCIAIPCVVGWLVAFPAITVRAGTPPVFRADFLGESSGVSALNESGVAVGTTSTATGLRGWIASVGSGLTLLPLPPSMMSSYANDINDAGVIAGAVSPSDFSPEFGGIAAAWIPDGAGGYTIAQLGMLPGDIRSNATAVNNAGDVVGYSADGTFRYPVLFTAPEGVRDLTFTGIFDPQDVNDRRVIVDVLGNRLDLGTMIVESLGVPASHRATAPAAINESNQVAGLVILATSTNCDREAARYTDGIGWEILSGCGSSNGAYDINDLGDVVMRLNLAPYVRFEGFGTFRIEDLIVADVGYWSVVNSFGLAINNSRQMAIWANNETTGQFGAVLLTPITAPRLVLAGPTPGTAGQTNTLEATGASPNQRVWFVAGRHPSQVNVPGCPGLTLGIAAPRLLGFDDADATGLATFAFSVPNRASGATVLFQAVDRSICTVSQVVTYTFP